MTKTKTCNIFLYKLRFKGRAKVRNTAFAVRPVIVLSYKVKKEKALVTPKNILQIVNEIEETINKKKLLLSSNNIVCAISGGQDSAFLLFCLSFLQSQISFKYKMVWCNHFWQICSFYTTLHLTKCAVSFNSPILGFLPFQNDQSPLFYKIVITKYKEKAPIQLENKTLSLKTRSQPYKLSTLLANFMQSFADKHKSKICKELCKASHFSHFFPKSEKSEKALAYKFFNHEENFYNHNLNIFFYSVWSLFDYRIELKGKGYKKFVKEISETRARNWRHITIERGCAFYESNACVYGHTGSDRVETILFNLIRGSGNRGTACLPWKRRHSYFCYNKFYPSYKQLLKNTHLFHCSAFCNYDTL